MRNDSIIDGHGPVENHMVKGTSNIDDRSTADATGATGASWISSCCQVASRRMEDMSSEHQQSKSVKPCQTNGFHKLGCAAGRNITCATSVQHQLVWICLDMSWSQVTSNCYFVFQPTCGIGGFLWCLVMWLLRVRSHVGKQSRCKAMDVGKSSAHLSAP